MIHLKRESCKCKAIHSFIQSKSHRRLWRSGGGLAELKGWERKLPEAEYPPPRDPAQTAGGGLWFFCSVYNLRVRTHRL